MTAKPRKSTRQRAREEISELLKQSRDQAVAEIKAQIEEMKTKHHAEIAIMAKEIDLQREALAKTYNDGADKLKAQHKKELDEARAEAQRQVSKYENEHVRQIDATVERDAARQQAGYFEVTYKNHLRRCLENGFRRAQHDPDYAVIRELLHAGQDLAKVDFMELAKAHPEATIFGMTLITEELGYKLNWDVKLRKAADESRKSIWRMNWSYPDMIINASMAVEEIISKVADKAREELNLKEDERDLKEMGQKP